MRFGIDTTKEVRHGLEKSGLSRLDLYYPAIFVPVIVDTEDEDEPWPYAETWVAFYFARPLIMSRGKSIRSKEDDDKFKGKASRYFDAKIKLFADDYLTCYRKINGPSVEWYVKDTRDLGIAEIDSLWNDLVKNDEENFLTIYSALSHSILLYNEIFGETGEEERAQKLLDYRKIH